MESTHSDDRGFSRRFPRRGFRHGIGILCAGKYWIVAGEGLGEGGVGFISDQVVGKEKPIVLTFAVPGGEFLCVRAEVRSMEKTEDGQVRHGCLFHDLSFDSKRQIRSYVSARPEHEVDVV